MSNTSDPVDTVALKASTLAAVEIGRKWKADFNRAVIPAPDLVWMCDEIERLRAQLLSARGSCDHCGRQVGAGLDVAVFEQICVECTGGDRDG